MKFLNRNLIVLHVAALFAYLAWVHAGTRVEHLAGVPWLTLALAELFLLLPQPRKAESLADAQRRVLHDLVRDPLFYVGLALCALLTIQWINGGGGVTRDPTGKFWVYGVPRFSWAPSSVASAESLQQLYWFPPVWVALLAVRHGMLRGGQRRRLQIVVWNGALLSAFGFIQNLSGTRALYWSTPLPGYFFSTFGYTNVAGAFFTLLFALSVGLWFQNVMDPDKRPGSGWLLIPVALNFAGAMGSLSRAAMLLSLILLVLGCGYCLWAAWQRLGLAGRIRVWIFGAFAVLVILALYMAFPSSNLRKELADIKPSTFYDETIGVRHFQYRSAWDMFKDRPFFGVGGWGYRHFARLYVTPEEYVAMVKGKGMANVHNDTLQFLAEHGAVGFGLMLAAVGILWIPIWRGARRGAQSQVQTAWGVRARKTPLLLRIPTMAWFVFAGTTATVVHSLIDLPFRSPPFLMAWTLALACAPAFLPRSQTPAAAEAE